MRVRKTILMEMVSMKMIMRGSTRIIIVTIKVTPMMGIMILRVIIIRKTPRNFTAMF